MKSGLFAKCLLIVTVFAQVEGYASVVPAKAVGQLLEEAASASSDVAEKAIKALRDMMISKFHPNATADMKQGATEAIDMAIGEFRAIMRSNTLNRTDELRKVKDHFDGLDLSGGRADKIAKNREQAINYTNAMINYLYKRSSRFSELQFTPGCYGPRPGLKRAPKESLYSRLKKGKRFFSFGQRKRGGYTDLGKMPMSRKRREVAKPLTVAVKFPNSTLDRVDIVGPHKVAMANTVLAYKRLAEQIAQGQGRSGKFVTKKHTFMSDDGVVEVDIPDLSFVKDAVTGAKRDLPMDVKVATQAMHAYTFNNVFQVKSNSFRVFDLLMEAGLDENVLKLVSELLDDIAALKALGKMDTFAQLDAYVTKYFLDLENKLLPGSPAHASWKRFVCTGALDGLPANGCYLSMKGGDSGRKAKITCSST